MTTIWIDADAAPGEMKEIVFRAAKRLTVPTVLVANQRLFVPPTYPLVSSISVDGTSDAADKHIAAHARAGDLVVTADVELAAAIVKRSAAAIDPRGMEYTADNAEERLSIRDFMDDLRGAGVRTGGPAPYGEKEKRAFAATLDKVLTRLLRAQRSEPNPTKE